MRPRYPILGGWKYSFTLGWDAPLGDSASYDAKTGTYIAEVPIMLFVSRMRKLEGKETHHDFIPPLHVG